MLHRVLLVDDSAMTRVVIKKILAMAKVPVAEILEAGDGLEAWQVLEQRSVDLVFADLNMPRMGGAELIARMRKDPRFCDLPVIVVSTEGSKTRLEQLVDDGVAGTIRKPFTPEQLNEVLHRVWEPSA